MKKIYSFDLFDTLVTRSVNHPKDIFTLIQATKKINYRFYFFKLISFKTIRVFSEKLARFNNRNSKEDIDIYEVYKVLSFFIKNPDEVLNIEINIELQLIKPKQKNIEILNNLRNKGEFICITSDMYLPIEIIKKILFKNKIYTDKIYVSSDIGLTKSSGNLFKFIANDLNVNLNQIIHHGDNVISDINIPNSLGCKTIHTGYAFHRRSSGLLDCFQSPVQDDIYYKIGYEFCGKIAYIFANHINTNIENNNLNLVFSARDSYLFKFAFELFFNKSMNFNTYYTRISRSLVYLPGAYFSQNYDIFFSESISCEEFFFRIGLNCPDIFEKKSAWKCKKDIVNYLKKNNEFNFILEKKSLDIKDYLKNNGFNKDLVLIDLGWKGSTQDSLNFIFKDDLKVSGLYLGTIKKDINKKGIIFNNKRPYKNYFYITQCLALFEFFFTEPQNSLNSIVRFKNQYKFIYTNDESLIQINNRKKIQNGAENFLLDFFYLNEKFKFDTEEINRSIRPLLFYNTMTVKSEIVSAFLNLSHSIGFNGSLKSNLIEFSNLSIKGYVTAPWKAYFMAELRKKSKIKYFIFLVLFHNVFFFVLYEYFKEFFRKIRAIIYG